MLTLFLRHIIYLEDFFIVKSDKTAVASQEYLKLQDWSEICYQGIVNEKKLKWVKINIKDTWKNHYLLTFMSFLYIIFCQLKIENILKILHAALQQRYIVGNTVVIVSEVLLLSVRK